MQTIQVVIDEKLLKAADRVAQRTKRNRSELIREALREHLRILELRALEERDRQGYTAQRSNPEGSIDWEAEAAWPPE
jgi:metal-responsive CopG/Arc/MetJ family transcriptional regulator